MTYAPDELYRQVAYVAYHFHWSRDQIMDLEHPERLRFIDAISEINSRRSQGG